MLAEHGGLDMDQAFHRRRRGYSRKTNAGLDRAARDLVDGHLDPNAMLGLARTANPTRTS